ncbi:MAG TPA: lipase maturation factor family protein [Polyangia bacterium]|nr:lipase maturation factor family protein [Polyangia bacterium]
MSFAPQTSPPDSADAEDAALATRIGRMLGGGSGPRMARLFHRLLALIFLIAWISLGVQVRVLIGARGLLPVADVFAAAHADQPAVSFADFPTLLWLAHGDAVLVAGTIVGALLALLALAGLRPRLCFALSTILYFSYATAGRLFLSFQWDNLLLECGFLAVFLPADRPSPAIHFLFRVLLFKLYFESGIAKWQSNLHDWQDGSAMTVYYETAPLPTALAWFAHNLPAWWHHVESRAVLLLELVVPFAIFGTRRARLCAAVAFTGFQILNIATANYGFFCYLALALNVFLLADPARLEDEEAPLLPPPTLARRGLVALGVTAFLGASLIEALFNFSDGGPLLARFSGVFALTQRTRVVNTYHLFAAITRERIEPEFQTLDAGADLADQGAWRAHDLWHKPGDPTRRPDFVAPHQPRVDFQLWFHGLSFRRRPAYMAVLLERMCEDAPAVQPLFQSPLPPHPAAVRVVYWQYHFTAPGDAPSSAVKAWWRRDRVATAAPILCPPATP